MDNIYNILAFASTTAYKKNDIISYTGTFGTLAVSNVYLYCLEDHTSGGSIDSTKWGGITVFNGRVRPHFFWEPDYNHNASMQIKKRVVSFGDGYELRMEDGITAGLINYTLAFNRRKQSEIVAITHFLYINKGITSFVFKGRPPYFINKLYICDEFPVEEVFADNYNLSATFRESTT